MIRLSVLTLCATLIAFTGSPVVSQNAGEVEVVLASDVNWEALNPARGDASPRAGTLWGDRKQAVPTGFLVQFKDGFSSPPHIHNVSYRGVVISGLVHNDDPNAAHMWMPPDSFWTQPKGESHITAAKGAVNVAYIEIEDGPYLVHPADQAFDSGERPVNVDPSNIVWLDAGGGSGDMKGPEVAYLWGSLGEGSWSGAFVRGPAGQGVDIRSKAKSFKAVVIQVEPGLVVDKGSQVLKPGSYFGSEGESEHRIASGGEASVLYVRTNGTLEVGSISSGE